MQAGFIVSLFFAIVVAVFALKNGSSVNIDFLFAKIQVSQAIVIFVSAALGAVIVTILGLVRQVKLTMNLKEQGKLITSLENEKQLLESKIEELKLKASPDDNQVFNENNNVKMEQERIFNANEKGKTTDGE